MFKPRLKPVVAGVVLILSGITVRVGADTLPAERQVLPLNNNCMVSILNRTLRATADGSFAMPNVPSFMGRIRARATCINPDGTITSGQTDYFNVVTNGKVSVGDLYIADSRVPATLTVTNPAPIVLQQQGQTLQLGVQAKYADNSVEDVTQGEQGTNYSVTDSRVVSITQNGLLTAVNSGSALLVARKDGAVAVVTVNVVMGGDTDGDGIPDEIELANGLNPNDPVDAFEDQDKDGLTALEEFGAGTGIQVADSDGDGINDGEELSAGKDGFVTNPLLADTDFDGLPDSLEVLVGSDPTDGNSANYASVLVSLKATPDNGLLFFNSLEGESSLQLLVEGNLVGGNKVNLTAQSRGTRYVVADPTIVNMSGADGEVFAGKEGTTSIAINNSGFTDSVAITVSSFAPRVLTYLDMGVTANNLVMQGDNVYVATATGFSVVNITNPSAPVKIASTLASASNDVKYHNGYLYVANATGVDVYDMSLALTPIKVHSINTSGATYDMALEGDVLALATQTQGVQLYSLAMPQLPLYLSAVTGVGAVDAVDISADLLVAVSTDDQVHGITWDDPLFPVLRSSKTVADVREVAIKGKVAFLAAYSTNKYGRVDFTNVDAPVFRASGSELYPTGIVIVDKFAFYAEELFVSAVPIVNVANVNNPVYSSAINMSRYGDRDCKEVDANDALVLCTSGSRLYINEYRKKVDNNGVPPVVNITSPLAAAVIEQGRIYAFNADVTDDVKVASVEFWKDGQKIATDLSAPYFTNFVVPRDATQLNLQVVARDIANNKTTQNRAFAVQPLSTADQVLNGTTTTGITSDLLYYGLIMQAATLQSTKTLETLGSFTVNGSATSHLTVDQLKVGGDLVVDGVVLELKTAKPVIVGGNVRIINGGSLTMAKAVAGVAPAYYPLQLQVTGDVEISAASNINVFGAGYAAGADTAYVWPNNAAVSALYNAQTPAGSHGGLRYGTTSGSFDNYVKARYAGNGGDYYNASITGYGGGYVSITANTFLLEGAILAQGDLGDDIGGAGGGVHIDVNNLDGAGLIDASGGMGRTSTQDIPGAGGRISIYVNDDSQFTGHVVAYAGYNSNAQESGAGTVYIKRGNETAGHLLVDNGKRKAQVNSTPLTGIGQQVIQSAVQNADESWTITVVAAAPWKNGTTIIDYRGLHVSLDVTDPLADTYEILANSGNTLTIQTNGLNVADRVGNTLQGVALVETLNVKQGASLNTGLNRVDIRDTLNSFTEAQANMDTSEILFGNFLLEATTMVAPRNKTLHFYRNLNLASNAIISAAPSSTTLAPSPVKIVADAWVLIGAGSSIDASGDGYTAIVGNSYIWPSNTSVAYLTGVSGSHGGSRKNATGREYGRYDRARFAGSGGEFKTADNNILNANYGSGYGGGIVEIVAGGLSLSGSIKADAFEGGYAGGAGGSVHIDVRDFIGAGSVSAVGGPTYVDTYGYPAYPGGGGRISVNVEQTSFTGGYDASGGGQYDSTGVFMGVAGGAGTVYVKKAADTYGALTINNKNKLAITNSTRIRLVGIRSITAVEELPDGTWRVTVSGTPWVATNEANDVGLQGLLVDLDNSSEEGPLYEVQSNGTNWIIVKVNAGQLTPGELGIAAGHQLIGVHAFKTLTVANGASLFLGNDRLATEGNQNISLTNAKLQIGSMAVDGNFTLGNNALLQISSTLVEGNLSLNNSDMTAVLPSNTTSKMHIKGNLTFVNNSTM